MLAASSSGSNVSPDNLKPTPLAGITARTPERFGKRPPRSLAQPDPRPAAQQHAVGLELPATPLAGRIPHFNAAVGVHPESGALTPAPTQRPDLACHDHAPYVHRAQSCRDRRIETGNNGDTGQGHGRGGPLHETAQSAVRCELGEVFVRWHARSSQRAVLAAARGTR